MAEEKTLPLFPLNTVLFPGMVLPLHIFEPRYRVMIQRCMRLNDPFGVVLIREGVEVGGEATPYEVGTSAYITHAERLGDGRLNIQTVGYQRFRIQEVTQEAPYLIGRVEDYPLEDAETAETGTLAERLRPDLMAYLQDLAEMTEASFDLDNLPEDATALAYMAAILLPLPALEKQRLLEVRDLLMLLRAEEDLLRREKMLLGFMQQERPSAASEPPFSLN